MMNSKPAFNFSIGAILILAILIGCSEPAHNSNDQQKKIEFIHDSIEDPVSTQHSDIQTPESPGTLRVKLFRPNEQLYDTTVHYAYLENNLFQLAMFNYPTLENKSVEESNITLFNDSISVRISRQNFDSTKHSFIFEDDGPFRWIRKIDNKPAYGVDIQMPAYEISGIDIMYKGSSYKFPKSEFQDLYEPGLELADVYLTGDGRAIIWMINGDDAGGYYAIWIWKKGVSEKRIVGRGM